VHNGDTLADHRAKLRYAVELSVSEICRTAKRPTFDTFTFADNCQDKHEAGRRWRRLKARLKRHYHGLRAVGVWQRQARGAWHLHVLFDRWLDVVRVRAWALECGFGSQLNMRSVKEAPGFRSWTIKRVAQYISRYITRDIDDEDKHVRVVDYTGDTRLCTTAFRWAHGIAYLWRKGRAVFSEIYNCRPATFEDFWFIIRLGWEDCSDEERVSILKSSDAVARWWDPDRYPF